MNFSDYKSKGVCSEPNLITKKISTLTENSRVILDQDTETEIKTINLHENSLLGVPSTSSKNNTYLHCSSPSTDIQEITDEDSCISEHDLIERISAKLYLAYQSLSPAIEEIINSACEVARINVQMLEYSKCPMCSVTQEQYVGAMQASTLIQEVKNEVIQNTECKMELIKGESPQFPVTNFIINTVHNTIYAADMESTSSGSSTSRIYIEKHVVEQLMNLYNLLQEALEQLYTIAEHKQNQASSSKDNAIKDKYSSISKLLQEASSSQFRHLNVPNDTECRENTKLAKLQEEYEGLRDTVNILKSIIQETSGSVSDLCKIGKSLLDTRKARSFNSVVETEHSETKLTDVSGARRCILECLIELAEVRKYLKDVNSAEKIKTNSPVWLTVNPKKNCCNRQHIPHLHAKLNGIPIVVKLKQETIDKILWSVESYPRYYVNEDSSKIVGRCQNYKCIASKSCPTFKVSSQSTKMISSDDTELLPKTKQDHRSLQKYGTKLKNSKSCIQSNNKNALELTRNRNLHSLTKKRHELLPEHDTNDSVVQIFPMSQHMLKKENISNQGDFKNVDSQTSSREILFKNRKKLEEKSTSFSEKAFTKLKAAKTSWRKSNISKKKSLRSPKPVNNIVNEVCFVLKCSSSGKLVEIACLPQKQSYDCTLENSTEIRIQFDGLSGDLTAETKSETVKAPEININETENLQTLVTNDKKNTSTEVVDAVNLLNVSLIDKTKNTALRFPSFISPDSYEIKSINNNMYKAFDGKIIASPVSDLISNEHADKNNARKLSIWKTIKKNFVRSTNFSAKKLNHCLENSAAIKSPSSETVQATTILPNTFVIDDSKNESLIAKEKQNFLKLPSSNFLEKSKENMSPTSTSTSLPKIFRNKHMEWMVLKKQQQMAIDLSRGSLSGNTTSPKSINKSSTFDKEQKKSKKSPKEHSGLKLDSFYRSYSKPSNNYMTSIAEEETLGFETVPPKNKFEAKKVKNKTSPKIKCKAESNTSSNSSFGDLPYKVSTRSIAIINNGAVKPKLPENKICHSNTRNQNQPKKTNIEILAHSSSPTNPKKLVSNKGHKSHHPYSVSLRSLPLDSADVENVNKTIGQSTKTKTKPKAAYNSYYSKLDYYSNLESDLSGMAKKTYEVRFFELKHDYQAEEKSTSSKSETKKQHKATSTTDSNSIKNPLDYSKGVLPWGQESFEIRVFEFARKSSRDTSDTNFSTGVGGRRSTNPRFSTASTSNQEQTATKSKYYSYPDEVDFPEIVFRKSLDERRQTFDDRRQPSLDERRWDLSNLPHGHGSSRLGLQPWAPFVISDTSLPNINRVAKNANQFQYQAKPTAATATPTPLMAARKDVKVNVINPSNSYATERAPTKNVPKKLKTVSMPQSTNEDKSSQATHPASVFTNTPRRNEFADQEIDPAILLPYLLKGLSLVHDNYEMSIKPRKSPATDTDCMPRIDKQNLKVATPKLFSVSTSTHATNFEFPQRGPRAMINTTTSYHEPFLSRNNYAWPQKVVAKSTGITKQPASCACGKEESCTPKKGLTQQSKQSTKDEGEDHISNRSNTKDLYICGKSALNKKLTSAKPKFNQIEDVKKKSPTCGSHQQIPEYNHKCGNHISIWKNANCGKSTNSHNRNLNPTGSPLRFGYLQSYDKSAASHFHQHDKCGNDRNCPRFSSRNIVYYFDGGQETNAFLVNNNDTKNIENLNKLTASEQLDRILPEFSSRELENSSVDLIDMKCKPCEVFVNQKTQPFLNNPNVADKHNIDDTLVRRAFLNSECICIPHTHSVLQRNTRTKENCIILSQRKQNFPEDVKKNQQSNTSLQTNNAQTSYKLSSQQNDLNRYKFQEQALQAFPIDKLTLKDQHIISELFGYKPAVKSFESGDSKSKLGLYHHHSVKNIKLDSQENGKQSEPTTQDEIFTNRKNSTLAHTSKINCTKNSTSAFRNGLNNAKDKKSKLPRRTRYVAGTNAKTPKNENAETPRSKIFADQSHVASNDSDENDSKYWVLSDKQELNAASYSPLPDCSSSRIQILNIPQMDDTLTPKNYDEGNLRLEHDFENVRYMFEAVSKDPDYPQHGQSKDLLKQVEQTFDKIIHKTKMEEKKKANKKNRESSIIYHQRTQQSKNDVMDANKELVESKHRFYITESSTSSQCIKTHTKEVQMTTDMNSSHYSIIISALKDASTSTPNKNLKIQKSIDQTNEKVQCTLIGGQQISQKNKQTQNCLNYSRRVPTSSFHKSTQSPPVTYRSQVSNFTAEVQQFVKRPSITKLPHNLAPIKEHAGDADVLFRGNKRKICDDSTDLLGNDYKAKTVKLTHEPNHSQQRKDIEKSLERGQYILNTRNKRNISGGNKNTHRTYSFDNRQLAKNIDLIINDAFIAILRLKSSTTTNDLSAPFDSRESEIYLGAYSSRLFACDSNSNLPLLLDHKNETQGSKTFWIPPDYEENEFNIYSDSDRLSSTKSNNDPDVRTQTQETCVREVKHILCNTATGHSIDNLQSEKWENTVSTGAQDASGSSPYNSMAKYCIQTCIPPADSIKQFEDQFHSEYVYPMSDSADTIRQAAVNDSTETKLQGTPFLDQKVNHVNLSELHKNLEITLETQNKQISRDSSTQTATYETEGCYSEDLEASQYYTNEHCYKAKEIHRYENPKESHTNVCWALTKIKINENGSQEFEIIDTSATPPGRYLIPSSNNSIVLLGNQPFIPGEDKDAT